MVEKWRFVKRIWQIKRTDKKSWWWSTLLVKGILVISHQGHKCVVASWHSNSGSHQENHKIRIMHVPTLLSQVYKTWPANCCSQNVIKRKLGRPALCCEDLMFYIWQPCAARRIKRHGSLALQELKTLCLSWQPCAARIKRPYVFL